MVACPHAVDNVKPASQLGDVSIQQVYIGSCTGGRLTDLKAAADILRGRKIHPYVRLLVSPASQDIYIQASAEGILHDLAEAGAMILAPTCGVCVGLHSGVIANGEALQTLANMAEAQGGSKEWILHPERFPTAKYSRTVLSPTDGYIVGVDTEGYGIASLLLGAGRNTMEDTIDFAAGIRLLAKTGDRVEKNTPIAILYTEDEARFSNAEARLLEATRIGKDAPASLPLILDVVE